MPLPKLAEAMQTTGEAKYVDDYDYANALHAVLVMSAQGNAAIADVDATAALKAPGVTAFISAKSLAEKGFCNQVSEHEELFVSKRAAYCGQAIGMIVAETKVRRQNCTTAELQNQVSERPGTELLGAVGGGLGAGCSVQQRRVRSWWV